MDESERNRLRNRQMALLLAVSDMEQAMAAAKVLTTTTDTRLARALETAIAVAYMRPFTRGPRRVAPEYVPKEGHGANVHATLKLLRDKVYAHTDKESGRHLFVEAVAREGTAVQIEWRESWLPLPLETVPGLIQHFRQLRDMYRTEAASLHVQLHGLGRMGV